MLPSFLTPGSSLLHRKDSTQLPTFPRRLLQDRIFTLSPKKERPKKRDFVYSLSVELTTAASSVLAFDCKQYTGTANPSDFQCKTYAQHRDFSTPRYILRSAIRFGWHHSKAILFCCRVFFLFPSVYFVVSVKALAFCHRLLSFFCLSAVLSSSSLKGAGLSRNANLTRRPSDWSPLSSSPIICVFLAFPLSQW